MKKNPLFETLQLGNRTLKNRIVLAPMTRGRAGKDRIPNELMAEYYFQRSSAGLLITEAASISNRAVGWIDSPGIFNDEMVKGWQKVTERIHTTGTPIYLQLWHCGRASHSDFHNGKPTLSASAIKINGDKIRTPYGMKKYETPKAMTIEEIKETIKEYRNAAMNAQKAGFSGIEIHGANGYLINQFLDSKTNHRTDLYGDCIENRFRFLKEILEAVLDVWPSELVGVRISPNGVFNDMGGEDFRETYLYIAQELNRMKLGYLHIMDGLAFGFHQKGEPMTLSEFRKVFKGIIIGNCGYSMEEAEKRLADRNADLAAFGRPFITNPDLPERFKNGWPLRSFLDMSLWYTPGAKGYTDYLPYDPSSTE